MAENPYTLMIDLLSRIRLSTIQSIRDELAGPPTGNQMRPDPWTSLKGFLSEEKSNDEAESGAKESPSIALLKTAGLRLVDNLSAANQQRDKIALRQSLEKRLEDSRIACMLFAINSGNLGMPWDGVELQHSANNVASLTVRIGSVSLVADDLTKMMPDLDWNLPVPAILPLDQGHALFVVGADSMRKAAIDSLHSVALRILLASPPGRIHVTVLDPLGYCMGHPPWHLWPDVVCTDSRIIEDRISQVFAQMEQISAEKLHEYKNLQEFNAWAEARGEPGVPLQVLIVHDCPNSLTPRSLQKLHGIARNGVRCGIIPLIHWGEKADGLGHSKLEGIAADGVILEPVSSRHFQWRGDLFTDCRVELDALPSVEAMERIVIPVVETIQNRASKTVEFGDIQQSRHPVPMGETSSMGIRVPLGFSETGKLVNLEIGEGKATHGLIIGGTGSGKSSLMHVIITGLAEIYSPEELQLYLIDLKGGVEFKRYATNHLPHAAVVAIDCEREFALSTLDSLCSEMRRRMDIYRASTDGITSLSMFREAGGQLPRILLVMDEFQKLFSESDDLADKARSKLESLLKEGRGFGIHVLLGTQSLKGILMRGGSLEQIALRVVLRCSPEDSREALASDNLAGSTLPKYHGIYNDQQGRRDANIQFKVAFLPPEENKSRIAALSSRFADAKWEPIVFEGNEKISISTCPGYAKLAADGKYLADGVAPWIWLGEPIAIQPPVEVLLDTGRGRNFIALMQDADEGICVLYNAMLALLAQNQPEKCRFTIFNLITLGHETREWPEKIATLFKHPISVVDSNQISASLFGLLEELNSRIQTSSHDAPHFVFVFGLQYARDLRPKESYGEPALNTPAGALRFLLKEGPENGMHVLVWCDMLPNLTRCGRGLLDEFGVRMAGKMEQSESNAVLGSPVAARLRGENRAISFDDSLPGMTKTFRPYMMPTFSLFESLSKKQEKAV